MTPVDSPTDDRRRCILLGGSGHHLGGVEAYMERAAEALLADGRWLPVPQRTDTAYLSIRRLLPMLISLWRLARRPRSDRIWLQYANLPDLVFLAVGKALGHRVLVTPHLGAAWKSQASPGLRALSVALLRLADGIALLSPSQDAEIALPSGPPRSVVGTFLPAAVLGPEHPHGERRDEPLRIVHAARLSPGKGSFDVVDVCAGLRDAGIDFTAVLAGGTDDRTADLLRRRIAEAGLAGRVGMPGRLGEADMIALLRQTDVLLHLSRVDAFPLIVLEALACGVFPVCVELAGARSMAERYVGHLVGADRAVAEAVAFLASHPVGELRRMADVAAASVRRDHAWAARAAAVDHALRALDRPG